MAKKREKERSLGVLLKIVAASYNVLSLSQQINFLSLTWQTHVTILRTLCLCIIKTKCHYIPNLLKKYDL